MSSTEWVFFGTDPLLHVRVSSSVSSCGQFLPVLTDISGSAISLIGPIYDTPAPYASAVTSDVKIFAFTHLTAIAITEEHFLKQEDSCFASI